MAADVNDVVSIGFGSWSGVNQLPTLGFGIATVSAPSVPGMEFAAPDQRPHYEVFDGRPHYKVPDNRPHLKSKGTD